MILKLVLAGNYKVFYLIDPAFQESGGSDSESDMEAEDMEAEDMEIEKEYVPTNQGHASWSNEEITAVSSVFNDCIRQGKCPNKLEILNAQRSSAILKKRDWKNIKWKVAYLSKKRGVKQTKGKKTHVFKAGSA